MLIAPAALDRGDPAALLERLLPCLSRAGITRIGVLTGLDTLGVPVAAAMRPNSRSLAVHQGKGATTAAAKLGAVLEAIECHCAETTALPLRLATGAEMGRGGLDLSRLPRARGGAEPGRLLWVEGVDLLAGGAVWVPREVVMADWSWPPVPGEGAFQASTNGLGAGTSRAAAVAHALAEVIERDAVAVWRARPAAARDTTALDPASVDGPASRALLDHLAGATVALWDATSDTGVPVVVALLGDPSGKRAPELGFGCDRDPDAAVWRAVMEAAQSRLTVISGARDDFSDADYGTPAVFRAPVPARSFAALRPGPDLLDGARRAGVTQLACVDLSDPAVPVYVVRIVAPGLEGGHTGAEGEYVPGPRALCPR